MKRALRWAPLLFWAAAAFTLVMALLPQPPRLPGEPSDKIQHVLAFAALALLARAAWPRAPLPLLLAGLCGFGALIELGQTIPALHRDAEWLDWLADTAAALAVLALVDLARRFLRRGGG